MRFRFLGQKIKKPFPNVLTQKPISECFNPKACKLQKFEKAAQIRTLTNFLEIYGTKILNYYHIPG